MKHILLFFIVCMAFTAHGQYSQTLFFYDQVELAKLRAEYEQRYTDAMYQRGLDILAKADYFIQAGNYKEALRQMTTGNYTAYELLRAQFCFYKAVCYYHLGKLKKAERLLKTSCDKGTVVECKEAKKYQDLIDIKKKS